MPTLLPEGVLSAEGEDAQAVNSSWETARSPSIEPGGVGAAWLSRMGVLKNCHLGRGVLKSDELGRGVPKSGDPVRGVADYGESGR